MAIVLIERARHLNGGDAVQMRASKHLGDGGGRVSPLLHLPGVRLLARGRVVGHSELLAERTLLLIIAWSDGGELAKVRK